MSDDRNVSVKAFLSVGDDKQEVRRFGIPEGASTNFNYVEERVRSVFGLGNQAITLCWQDSDGDQIVISSDDELLEAISDIISKRGETLLRLYVTIKENKSNKSDKNYETDKVVHEGVVCDSCNGPVIGIRFKCSKCLDFDLCEACEAKGAHSFHSKIRMTEAKNPFSAYIREAMRQKEQHSGKQKCGFEKEFSEKCDVNEESKERGKCPKGKWRGHGRRWSRGGQWGNCSLDEDGPHYNFHFSNGADDNENFDQHCNFSSHHNSQMPPPPPFRPPHFPPPPHTQPPHSPGPNPQFGTFPGGWPFVSVGVGVPPNMEQFAPEAQRVAEEASKFASQMASKHVADIVKGIWTAWAGHNGDFSGCNQAEETTGTNASNNSKPSQPAQTTSDKATSSNSPQNTPESVPEQFGTGNDVQGRERIINIDIDMDCASMEKDPITVENEQLTKIPVENSSQNMASTPMDTDRTVLEEGAAAFIQARSSNSPIEEWTLLNRDTTLEGAKEIPVDRSTREEIDNDIIEIPIEITQEEPVALSPEELRIKNALDNMKAMGYSDEGGWLTRLLQMKNGDINQVLDILLVRNKPKN